MYEEVLDDDPEYEACLLGEDDPEEVGEANVLVGDNEGDMYGMMDICCPKCPLPAVSCCVNAFVQKSAGR